ncbi:MAG: hypothetical protein EZS28_023581 [Streblomastix strix]|uniref:Uncharacterized protein n=1 Tax=Streblomastix strix TaxID=222440 RepID=A0A5J4VEL5_9EUKA|nr:MAG: hypothetical protein EZS28_023581 [Streblomastix strix]
MGKEDEIKQQLCCRSKDATGDFAFSAESGTVWMYESEWYDSGQLVPDQVTPASDELPLVNGEASAGISTSYSRGDHKHPPQLTYDNDITATKFIKTGGTATEILLANGDTTTIDSKISRTYSSGAGGYIRLCVFPIGTSTGTPYIQFQVSCNTNSMQTIDLLPQYTVNGIIDLYGSYSSAVYTAWIHMMSGSGGVTVTVSIRISRSTISDYSGIYLGCDPNSTTGTISDQWSIVNTHTGELRIGVGDQLNQSNRGLQISADGNTLIFYGRVI